MNVQRMIKDGFRSPWIEGYCSKQSVKAGEAIDIMVSTDPPRWFRIEIFRMGYYGGRGARLVRSLGPLEGKTQSVPKPGAKNLHECHWQPSAQVLIAPEWVSGVYLGRLTTVSEADAEPYWQREFPLAYWLEQHGYDVTYCSNSDMLTPDHGLNCKAFLSVGHDEYWDIRQFRSVEQMRDAGVNLLFFSGNAICWVAPFRASSDGRPNRIFFRGGPYGADNGYAKRRQAEHGPFPEHGPDEGLLMGARNVEPVNGGGDWVVVKPDHWIFAGTSVKKGDRIPGLIGWEYHGDPPRISGLEIVAAGTAWVGGQTPQQWTATIYPGPKGNFVFNASTIFWAQGLSSPPGHTLPWSHWSRPHGPDERVQKITQNLLQRAIRGRR